MIDIVGRSGIRAPLSFPSFRSAPEGYASHRWSISERNPQRLRERAMSLRGEHAQPDLCWSTPAALSTAPQADVRRRDRSALAENGQGFDFESQTNPKKLYKQNTKKKKTHPQNPRRPWARSRRREKITQTLSESCSPSPVRSNTRRGRGGHRAAPPRARSYVDSRATAAVASSSRRRPLRVADFRRLQQTAAHLCIIPKT